MSTYFLFRCIVFGLVYTPLGYSLEVGTILGPYLDEVVETDPEECIREGGYLDGKPYRDCCSFVQCDAADGNKTGILTICVQWVFICVWDDSVKSCVRDKWISPDQPGCDGEGDCPIYQTIRENIFEMYPQIHDTHEKRHLCPLQKQDNTCCEHQNATFPGFLPLVEYDPDDVTMYRYNNDPFFQPCPENSLFNPDTCFCEAQFSPVEPCDDPSGFYFRNPNDPCCSYLVCFANRTGYYEVKCMPPSVWNDVIKSCDIPQNVMDCMDEDCGTEMTDPPCEGNLGTCCRAGLWYELEDQNPNIFYILNSEFPHHGQCCPMVGDTQWVFNDDPDVCCCEEPSEF